MKQIKLTQGRFTLVDDADFEYLNQWKWQAQRGARTYYAVRTEYYPIRRKVFLHRELIECHGKLVDHIDGNGLNCQKINLRTCTKTENNRNKKPSGNFNYLGVTYKKETKRWNARIMVNRKAIHLGYFDKPEDAAIRYNEAAKLYFGEFANLNVVKVLTLKY